MSVNLRHLRVFAAVASHGSITRAAEDALVSQPAVTQSMAKLGREAGTALLRRTPQGLFPTEAGSALARRVGRALAILDPALDAVAPRLRLTATAAQLHALTAMAETENFTLAARRLGVAQPTVHRAVTQLEQEAGRALFERTARGMPATRACLALARAARLAFAELDQADADIAELFGREVGRIVVGAMPLSRSSILPSAIAAFRTQRAALPVLIRDGPYEELLAGLRRGEIDMLIGALRDPAPTGDVEQELLFQDDLVLVAGPRHPLVGRVGLTAADLAGHPWVVARRGTPARAHFDRLFDDGAAPASIVESGSVILARELLYSTSHLACISRAQALVGAARGLMTILPLEVPGSTRPIGLTLRSDWMPTRAQSDFLDQLRASSALLAARPISP